MDGVCGSCKVDVLEGMPDHRDVALGAEERAANRTMLVCCSRAFSERLVLDL
jgi:vanillate O-demethylase ferredoxin subunit